MTPAQRAERHRHTDAHLSARFDREAVPLLGHLRAGAIRLTGNPVDGDDLLQETCLRAWTSFGSFAEGTNLRAWLNRILVNTFINDYRKRAREPHRLSIDETTDARWGPSPDHCGLGQSAEAAAFGRLIDKDVKAAFALLPRSHQHVLYMADVEGYTYKEIARLTGTPVNTVGSRLIRARRRLRTLLDTEQSGRR
ncbi:sigma-70 family RNA polymerase sigma factor [Streptomyces sp. OE57]|uniref:sigma-70 family RNA polymerase sigma factor n=1 Tax=Streptomyces lacaronensis TaxID=3379885 RepID=UPI0039B7667E